MTDRWHSVRLSDVATRITKGTTPTTSFKESGIVFVKVESITNDGRIDRSRIAYIDEQTDARLSRSRLECEDILFSIAGTIGRVAQVEKATLPANTNQAVAIVRPNREVIDSRFLYYVLRDSARVREAQTRVVQSVQANLSLAELSQFGVPLPPLPEQRLIASVLGALDDKIDLNRRINEALEALARVLFKSWFVDFDTVRAKAQGHTTTLAPETATLFPSSFAKSEIGEIPTGWRAGSAVDTATLNPEVWSKTTRPEAIRYIDLSAVKWGRIEPPKTYEQSQAPSRAQRILRPGDTLVGTVRPGNGSYGLVADNGLTGSTGFAVLRPTKSKAFTYLAVTSKQNIERLGRLADGAAYPAVRSEVVGASNVALPSEDIFDAFEAVASPLLDRYAHANRESGTLAAIRDALLPRLVSGELAVAEAANILEKSA